jgi:hypothetical protein
MVRAILAGQKDVTRRILREAPGIEVDDGIATYQDPNGETQLLPAPFAAGDRLWVREAWRTEARFDALPPRAVDPHSAVDYECDLDTFERGESLRGRYRHARFMPRWASRIDLDVVSVRAERLHEITDDDALREGIPAADGINRSMGRSPREAYCDLWVSLHGPDSWASNSLVWRIEFRRNS